MIDGKKILGIIPARGGSKGLPGKNIRDLCGKPLIAWTIDEALQSKYLDEVMVTTDSAEITTLAKASGAKVPFLRPAELAKDTSATIDSILHAIEYYHSQNQSFDYICLLEPTSPLREVQDIDRPIEILHSADKQSAESIVGICKTIGTNPAFLVEVDSQGLLKYFDKNSRTLRRQEIKDYFFFEGTIYVSRTEALLKEKSFYHDKTLGYEVPKWKSHEVDDIWDLITIEAIIKYRMEKK